MKTAINKKAIVFSIIILAVMGFAGCSKAKGPYYNFEKQNTFNGSVYDFIKGQPPGQFDSLLFAIDRVQGLKDSLQNQKGITLLAVNNASFTAAVNGLNNLRKLQNRQPLYLATINAAQLDTLLCRYVLTQQVLPDTLQKFKDGVNYPTVKYGYMMNMAYNRNDAQGYMEGGALELYIADPKNSIFTRFWVPTYATTSGVYAANGIIYTITDKHVFGFGEFVTRLVNS
ncbi:MAG: hypothetical protein J7539_07645 [Niabella sp.]|nr:hypothetical protein [Niabella sp.]